MLAESAAKLGAATNPANARAPETNRPTKDQRAIRFEDTASPKSESCCGHKPRRIPGVIYAVGNRRHRSYGKCAGRPSVPARRSWGIDDACTDSPGGGPRVVGLAAGLVLLWWAGAFPRTGRFSQQQWG